jgi:hypothetical protein
MSYSYYWDRQGEGGRIILKLVLYICSVLMVITFLKFKYHIQVLYSNTCFEVV